MRSPRRRKPSRSVKSPDIRRIGIKKQLVAHSLYLTRDRDRLRDKIENLQVHRSVRPWQEPEFRSVSNRVFYDEQRRDPAAQAGDRALAMRLSSARIHHAKMTFAVNDLAFQRMDAEALGSFPRRRRRFVDLLDAAAGALMVIEIHSRLNCFESALKLILK